MPKTLNLKRGLGIAGKDTVAMALIAKGVPMIDGPQWYIGVICILLGFGLFAVQQFT